MTAINLTPLTSSNLAAAGYDPATICAPTAFGDAERPAVGRTIGTLRIRFKSGGAWDYLDAPPDVYAALLQAESAGKYFYRAVKSVYEARKVVETA